MLGKKNNLICRAGAERAGPHHPVLAQCQSHEIWTGGEEQGVPGNRVPKQSHSFRDMVKSKS